MINALLGGIGVSVVAIIALYFRNRYLKFQNEKLTNKLAIETLRRQRDSAALEVVKEQLTTSRKNSEDYNEVMEAIENAKSIKDLNNIIAGSF